MKITMITGNILYSFPLLYRYSDLRKLPMWRRTRNYFPVKMVKTAELPPVKNYLFASFPHGVSCYGMATNIITEANRFSEAYPGLNPYVVTLKEIFYFPITRDIWLALGKVFFNCK